MCRLLVARLSPISSLIFTRGPDNILRCCSTSVVYRLENAFLFAISCELMCGAALSPTCCLLNDIEFTRIEAEIR